MSNPERQAILDALTILTQPDQVVELRVPKVDGRRGRTDSGYFTDYEKLAQAALGYTKRAEGIYITLNPINPALLARAPDCMKEWATYTTADRDVLQRCWLPIDIDPARPAGVSSSKEEHEQALEAARECRHRLAALGWPDPVLADSGNGAHLLYQIDLPNDAQSTKLIKAVLENISLQFSNDHFNIDTSVANAGRIWKLYGTMARKGANML